jgi:acetylornithine/succinyldiaminopimelate/putrescine aminotransferase
VSFVAPDDAAALASVLREKSPAALILEPIQGESGVRCLDPDYLRQARRLTSESGTLLIHDEVQCGSGRTGTFLYGEQLDLQPDIVTLAKPIAAGLPMGMALVSRELAQTLQPGDHGSTFAGGPLVCRGALCFLDEIEQHGLLENVRARGAQLRAGLEELRREFAVVRELRGLGLIQGLRLERGAEALQKQLYQDGLITNRTGGDVLRLLPPYVITQDEIAQGLELLRAGLRRL